MQSATASMDLTRHKEIVVKAVSFVFKLLLDHAAVSHTYQFEYMALLLVDANCILLLLKFLNQDVNEFITTRNDLPDLEAFAPLNPPVDDPDTAAAAAQPGTVSWRNFASSLNFITMLSMLTRNNPVRIRQLVRYKAPAILKRILKILHQPTKILTLALLKRQLKFLGKKWRSSNTKIITMIYLLLPPDLDTSWLYPDAGIATTGIALAAPWTLSVGMQSSDVVAAAAAAAAAVQDSDNATDASTPFGMGILAPQGLTPAEQAAADQDRDFLLRKAIAVFNQRNYHEFDRFHNPTPSPLHAHYVHAHDGRLRTNSELESLYFEPTSFAASYTHWLDSEVFPDVEDVDDDTLLDSMRPAGYVDEVDLPGRTSE
ncbi:uncharacterized protein AMSG_06824 [Thecamonas trahens ATCC 50062]|uniref:Far11/STRP C-terminal domain-containing protein n=1 Tax=Thecamonas trahens ATCC 50062 TaxID=461836 RepID=A0A0L0DDP2_THETB|nr:hypothetical protein AMSG_06824 [Thecamonas trahens ATCC 50062]KNC50340.1 hypothetical protein AMSG_06824 [Thecamonas trahens ATCC 50062]|eukprot:XP_013756886.1 hypothetical protein AMSG_06824 [Thecamonas trahens ATCC 50062]